MNARNIALPPPNEQPPDRSRQSVLRQLAALQTLSVPQLKDRWRDLFCTDPPAYNRQFLIRRLAYRIQELFYGGLSQAAREALRRVAAEDPLANMNKSVNATANDATIIEGTRFMRTWKGRRYEVLATQLGFEYEGQSYRSLSAIAKLITGSHWNGRAFFGVKSAPREAPRRKRKK
jgi:hypothetical protein